LKQILKYLNVSNCNMEEGSLRCDANVSLRLVGAKELGTKTEVKNMNSFKAVEKALAYEINRQRQVLDAGERVHAVTLLWNDATEEAVLMRSKEEAHDYRYFPEPDLVPISVSTEKIGAIRDQLPELPEARSLRFKTEYALNDEVVSILIAEVEFANYFEATVRAGALPKSAASWVTSEVLRLLKEGEYELASFPISPAKLCDLLNQIDDGKISNQAAKKVFEWMLDNNTSSVLEIINELGLAQINDEDALGLYIAEVIAENPDEVRKYREGKKQLLGFFVGKVMQKSGGSANPKSVGELVRSSLENA